MSTIKVDAIRSNSASSDAITLDGNGKCAVTATTVTGTSGNFDNLPSRNLIINGAMQVAQRGSSSTSNSYATVDRMSLGEGGLDETCTQSQISLGSSDVGPYAKGFRQAYRIQNGNQTSGAGATDFIRFEYRLEAQDIANSGWDYTNSNSKISLQFWIRSSVAQNFYFIVNSTDGTARSFPMETGSLSAGTWTKVTKTISGDSSLTFDNNNETGLTIFFYLYLGTSYANNSVSLNAWRNVANPQTPTNTTTWFTTNDATWDITGLQLEVGSTATDFEHRSYGHELYLCQRYLELVKVSYYYATGVYEGSGNPRIPLHWNVEKRATPTITLPTIGTGSGQLQVVNSGGSWDTGNNNLAANYQTTTFCRLEGSSYGGGSGENCSMYYNGTNGSIQIHAEL